MYVIAYRYVFHTSILFFSLNIHRIKYTLTHQFIKLVKNFLFKERFFTFNRVTFYVSLACHNQSFCNTLRASRATKLNLESFGCARQYVHAHVSRVVCKIYWISRISLVLFRQVNNNAYVFRA